MRHFFLLASLTLMTLAGCGGKTVINTGDDGCSSVPRDIKGLVIDGPRPRQNVIENLWPIICNWRHQCAADNRSDRTGTIFLKIVVDKVGDIGVESYQHTIADSAYVDRLVSGLYLLDFDPWNDQPEATRIELPVELVPLRTH